MSEISIPVLAGHGMGVGILNVNEFVKRAECHHGKMKCMWYTYTSCRLKKCLRVLVEFGPVSWMNYILLASIVWTGLSHTLRVCLCIQTPITSSTSSYGPCLTTHLCITNIRTHPWTVRSSTNVLPLNWIRYHLLVNGVSYKLHHKLLPLSPSSRPMALGSRPVLHWIHRYLGRCPFS
jgi:hypothetical protein